MKHVPIQLLVPMSGQGTRYKKAGYTLPKPLIPINGVPMIERLLAQFPISWPAHFVLAENHRRTALPALLKKCRPNGKIYFVPEHSSGPGLAIEKALPHMPAGAPVFVSYCDYGMVWDSGQFEKFVRDSACDACVISYRGFHAHYLSPVTYAFSRMEGEMVKEVREKGSFTDNRENEFASSGGYYFKSPALLKKALSTQKKLKLEKNGEFYTSLTVEGLLQAKSDAHVRVFEIPGFFQWGTPEDLVTYEYWEKTYQAWNAAKAPGDVDQILMPMAGLGSRLEKFFSVPKPFVKLQGTPMYEKALASLPVAKKTVVVTLERARPWISSALFLKETPAGQAYTTLEGMKEIDPAKEVIVSACDHAIMLGDQWEKFKKIPGVDAAIFTVRGFPGVNRQPKAFTYVRTSPGKSPFLDVKEVSVKTPISDRPSNDPLLVGTFWFRSGALLNQGIQDLLTKGTRVNNELYLDGIFNQLISLGKKVRIIPLDGYINWGDPDSLAEALYWQEIFGGHRLDVRTRFPGATA